MTVGKVTLREPVIDYTEVAQPLTVDDIADDLARTTARYALHVGSIIMWEHQWDWLIKDIDNRGIGPGRPDERVGYKMILGVKVEIR